CRRLREIVELTRPAGTSSMSPPAGRVSWCISCASAGPELPAQFRNQAVNGVPGVSEHTPGPLPRAQLLTGETPLHLPPPGHGPFRPAEQAIHLGDVVSADHDADRPPPFDGMARCLLLVVVVHSIASHNLSVDSERMRERVCQVARHSLTGL